MGVTLLHPGSSLQGETPGGHVLGVSLADARGCERSGDAGRRWAVVPTLSRFTGAPRGLQPGQNQLRACPDPVQEPRDPSAAAPQFPHRCGAPGLCAVFAQRHVHRYQGADPTTRHWHQEHGDGVGSCPSPVKGSPDLGAKVCLHPGDRGCPSRPPQGTANSPSPIHLEWVRLCPWPWHAPGKTFCKARRCWAAARWAEAGPQHPSPCARHAPTGPGTPLCRQAGGRTHVRRSEARY